MARVGIIAAIVSVDMSRLTAAKPHASRGAAEGRVADLRRGRRRPQGRQDRRDHLFDRSFGGNDNGVLTGDGRLKRRQLTVEKARRKEMTAPRGETPDQGLARYVEMNETHGQAGRRSDALAIAPLQGRAGDDNAVRPGLPNGGADGVKPGPPI